MSTLTACLRVLPRAHKPPHVSIRPFHSPFVILNAPNRLTTPPSPAPIYEKQDDSSSEPHLSSSGTRTYVVSEPDPSNTPYEVPSGAYPASSSYVNFGPTSSSPLHPHNARAVPQKEAGVGQSAAVKNAGAPGEMGRRAGKF